jgi:dTDP-4-amino-4,6-dideoxygalactose transaminase
MNSTLVAEPTEIAPQTDYLSLPGLIGTFMGRDALSLAASYLNLGFEDTVLLPAYNCKEVVRPFARRTRLAFYDVRPDLAIDPDEIRAFLRTTRVKMMLIINYFGFLQTYRKELKKICADQGVILIEDCAHSLLTEGSGNVGDLSVYSFRKLLPLPDGGGLRVNIEEEPVKPKFHPVVYSNGLSVLSSAKSFFNIRSDTFSRAGVTSGREHFRSDSTPPPKDGYILPMSWFARRGLSKASCAEIIERKRNDYEFWQMTSRGNRQFAPIFESLTAGVCPIGFPVRIKNRESIVSRARKEGVQLRVHWRLPAGTEERCRNSHAISTESLTLPLYPQLGAKEREIVLRIIAGA